MVLLNCGVGEDSRVTWTARRSKPSTLKEIRLKIFIGRTDAEAETQYFGHLMWKGGKKHRGNDSMEKTLMLGKIEGRTRRGQQKTGWLDGIIDLVDMSLSKLLEVVKNRETWHGVTIGHNFANEKQQ